MLCIRIAVAQGPLTYFSRPFAVPLPVWGGSSAEHAIMLRDVQRLIDITCPDITTLQLIHQLENAFVVVLAMAKHHLAVDGRVRCHTNFK